MRIPLVRAAAPLAALALCLALAAPAGAQQAPSLGAPDQQETAPAVTQTTTAGDDGLKTWQQVLIFGAGVVLLGGIAWAIVGDARQRAPVAARGRAADEAGGARGGGHDSRRRKDRARARGRAQRRARRRNR